MTLEDSIAKGESNVLEFKEMLSEHSAQRLMRTVVAFANGTGGRIIIGIKDGTLEIVGVENEKVFEVKDAIARTIADGCAPLINPDISYQTIAGKTVIIIDIPQGRQRPYFVKKTGPVDGVYIRVDATNQQVDGAVLQELTQEGMNRCYDKIPCQGLEISSEEIQALCASLTKVALGNCYTDETYAQVRPVTPQQLLSWGIIREENGRLLPNNAFALLAGHYQVHAETQCAVFKGKTKEFFIDRREYTGPIQEQLEQTIQFVLRNIHLGAVINGLQRQDVYEIPYEIIRELLTNCFVHRSWSYGNNIRIAVFDNRLEIISPGRLPMGQTLEKMRLGFSCVRNEALAAAFTYMRFMEHWGYGIPMINQRLAEAGLQPLEITELGTALKLIIYRRVEAQIQSTQPINTPKGAEKTQKDAEKSAEKTLKDAEKTSEKIVHLMQNNPTITINDLMSTLNRAERTICKQLAKLQSTGVIRRVGPDKGGHWEVISDNKKMK